MRVTIFKDVAQLVENALAYIFKDNRNYYKFGEQDKLPNDIINTVNDSGTARACVERLTQFTQGIGFADATLGASKANSLQSYNSVLAELSLIVSYLKCSSFRVLFNNEGGPARIYPTPTQLLRRVGRRGFVYNELMGYPQHRTSNNKYLQIFDPTEAPGERLKRVGKQISMYGEQFGDVVYHFKKGMGLYQDIYSIPGYYSGIDDIESDSGISRLEKRNIQKGWRAQVFVSTGPLDHYVGTGEDGKGPTQFERFTETIKKFTGDDASTILHLEGATNEVKPDVKIMDVADILDQTEKATDRVGKKVCRHMGVPPILVGFSTEGKLGDAAELKNTMDLFRLTITSSQDLIKESLRLVFPEQNWDINPLTLWEPVQQPTPPAP